MFTCLYNYTDHLQYRCQDKNANHLFVRHLESIFSQALRSEFSLPPTRVLPRARHATSMPIKAPGYEADNMTLRMSARSERLYHASNINDIPRLMERP